MRTFEIRDSVLNSRTFSKELLSSEPLSHFLNCAKVLHGRADVKVHSTNQLLRCRKNYSTSRQTRDGIRSLTLIRELFGPDITEREALGLIKSLRKINVAFFRKFETELTHCCVNHLSGNPLTAFLHLYRAIEKIAVAFPLTYIASQSDFERSLEALKAYFSDDKGELSFAKKFSEKFAESSTTLAEFDVEFKTKYRNIPQFEILSQEIIACCPGFIEGTLDVDQGEFRVNFVNVSSFIVSARNRLFHFSNSGQRNFDVDRLGGVSELCRMLVEGGLQWLALSFDEVVRRQTDRISLSG